MRTFRMHTVESAPAASKQSLEALQQNFGLVPNLAATMAESPTLINGFVGAFVNFAGGTLNGAERQVLLLTNAVANRSAWPVAFHSTAALREGVAWEDIDAIRNRRTPLQPKSAALATLTRRLIETRGAIEDADLEQFEQAGYSRTQALEVVAGIAVSAMANYASHITKPELEAPFRAQEWTAA